MNTHHFRTTLIAFAVTLFSTAVLSVDTNAQLIITGLVDGDLTGGTPKAVELYSTSAISDLSQWAFGSATNGGGTDGPEFTLSGSTTAGEFIYVTSSPDEFNTFFESPSVQIFQTGAAGINGDDPVELFFDSTGEFDESLMPLVYTVVDTFGDINMDGTGEPWEYADGWAYRNDGTAAGGSTFTLGDWTYSGRNALDDELLNSTAATRFPIGSYTGSTTGGLACDLVVNNQCDLADIENLIAAVVSGSKPAADIDTWLTNASLMSNPYLGGTETFMVGDLNLDGVVNSSDLGDLLANFGSTADLRWADGNFTGDGIVDSSDLGPLLTNFGHGTTASAQAVPEPGSVSLLLLALVGFTFSRRRA